MYKAMFFIGLLCATLSAYAANPVLGEVELIAASRAERDAGVWVDGQYVGYVRNIRGGGKLVLVPGEHQLEFKLIGHQDVTSTIVVEPGKQAQYRVTMPQNTDLTYPEKAETARLRVSVTPAEAAVFVNDAFVGHVDRFDGANGMRLKAGTYRFTIALPGYQAFETEMTLVAGQNYEIKTNLPQASIEDQASELTAGDAIDALAR